MKIKKFVQRLLGIDEVLGKLSHIETLFKREVEWMVRPEEQILSLLKKPLSTQEIARHFDRSRSWASRILNKMEKEGQVKELKREERKPILYAQV